jgi:hypothetical protein
MGLCNLCGRKADFVERCPFRDYLPLNLCIIHRIEEKNFHKENGVPFSTVQLLIKLPRKGVIIGK